MKFRLQKFLMVSVSLMIGFGQLAEAQITDTNAVWIWKNGLNGTGRYQYENEKRGTLGVPYTMVAPPTTQAAMNNWPGSRGALAYWSDTTGRMYQFGGAFNDQNSFNQVWRIHPDSNTWTWVHGKAGYSSTVAMGVLVTAAGVPHVDNMPHNRHSMHFAADSAGCFWIFGGLNNTTSNHRRNDLWKYNPYDNQWTWFNGSTVYAATPLASYGTKGVSSPTNQPGARGGQAGATWIDNKNKKLYIFSGYGVAKTTTIGLLTDFWSYDMVKNEWTWIGGGDTITNSIIADYGTKGVAAATNFPQPRREPLCWVDNKGIFWMYGGLVNFNITGTAEQFNLNDLWKYDPNTGMWTWVAGDKMDKSAAVGTSPYGFLGKYGTRGVTASSNYPGSRFRAATWVDKQGHLWFFGGHGLTESPVSFTNQNDIWKYDPEKNEWTWMFGSEVSATVQSGTPGVYVAGAGASPGGRSRSAVWVDKTGNFWTFGGNGGGTPGEPAIRSDLWKLEAKVPVIPAQPDRFTSAKSPVCTGESNLVYSVPSVSGATSYEWKYTGTNVTFNATTTASSNTLSFAANATGGTLSVRGVGSGGPGPWRDSVIVVNVSPTVSVSPTGARTICAGESLTLTATASAGVTYQWKNGASNVGTNSATFAANAAGSYTVVVTANGCSATSTPATALTVTPLPTVSISPASATICAGESVTLTASGATSYSWSPAGGTAASATVSPTTNTTYTVTGTSNGCSSTATRTVTVNPVPVVTATNTGAREICDGDSLLLTASSGGTVNYEWKNGTATVGTGANYYAKAAGTYTVTATNTGTNCAATSSPATVLTVNPLPVAAVTAGGPTEICTGSVVSLNASPVPGASFQWIQDGNAVGTNANNYDAGATGSYQVRVTYTTTGCTDISTPVDVVVHKRPNVTLVPGDTAFCEGGIVTLSVATPDTALTFRWLDNGNVVPLASADFLEISTSGVYKVEVGRSAVAGCDTTTNEVTVTVHPLPVVSASWDGETLSATPGFAGYQWYVNGQGIPGAINETFKPTAIGTYTVSVVDINGCEGVSTGVQVAKIGISDVTLSAIKVYPNPVSGILYIDYTEPVNVILTSVEGRKLAEFSDVQTVDMNAYPSGVYMLRISDKQGSPISLEKIIKQ